MEVTLFDRPRCRRAFVAQRSVPFWPRVSTAVHRSVSLRTRLLFAVFTLGVCASSAFAGNRIYCYQRVIEPGATGGGKIEVNGFIIEVQPVAAPDEPGGMTCRATITSPQGKVVYEQSDWGMEIDPITGKDINGDGQPDAVLVGFSGGAHCCWTYHFISLGQTPGLIREFENQASASFKDLRGDGQIEILIQDGDYDFGFGLDHALSVFPLLIVQLNGSTFKDVGTEFWPVFDKEIRQERDKLNSQRSYDFLNTIPNEPHDDSYLNTKSSVLLIVLNYLYSGRPKEAKATLGQLWPPDSQEQTWKEMLTGYCSGVRASLGVDLNPPCSKN